jgi:hypothetical protein
METASSKYFFYYTKELKTDSSWAIYFRYITLSKKLIFAIVLVALSEHQIIQMVLLGLINLAMIIYQLMVKPYKRYT